MEPAIDIVQVILSLVLVMGLVGLCAFAFKYASQQSALAQRLMRGGELQILERRMIDGKSRLVLASWNQRKYLLLVHATGAEVIDVDEAMQGEGAV